MRIKKVPLFGAAAPNKIFKWLNSSSVANVWNSKNSEKREFKDDFLYKKQ